MQILFDALYSELKTLDFWPSCDNARIPIFGLLSDQLETAKVTLEKVDGEETSVQSQDDYMRMAGYMQIFDACLDSLKASGNTYEKFHRLARLPVRWM